MHSKPNHVFALLLLFSSRSYIPSPGLLHCWFLLPPCPAKVYSQHSNQTDLFYIISVFQPVSHNPLQGTSYWLCTAFLTSSATILSSLHRSHTALPPCASGTPALLSIQDLWLILLWMFFPQISTWFTSLPPSNFASNVSFPLKPSSNILFKIACHPLTFPILLYFSPLDLLSNMPYNLPNLAIVYLFSLECKLHEDRHFCLFCSLIYTPVLRSKPGT